MRKIITKFVDFIGKSLLERDGKPSLTRILTFYVGVLLSTCLGFGFVYVCLRQPQYVGELGWAIAGTIALSIGAKNWHSVKQNKPEGVQSGQE